nr:bifunctional diaminohydroxyphosphoribosylaminopyrimidine deaminase/5-amino-6-(5-phosphoribosylamino)uracil reductase RibD [Thermaerobacter subterraneus]
MLPSRASAGGAAPVAGRARLAVDREADRHFMRRALDLAARAGGRTHPNPMVGAVIVRDGVVVGEGYHRRAGEPHAEVEALRSARDQARGATLYVTLEPCCHHGRTPPCTEAILAAGLRRVVVAMVDPDPRVAGRGLSVLAQAGVEVAVGVEADRALRLNEAYVVHRVLGRPMVTAKYAMTLDGRIATARGESRWITGPRARRWVHRLRDRVDAILVGVGTVLADDPSLTVRWHPGGRDPVRVILDSHARTPPDAQVIRAARHSPAPTWVAVTPQAPAVRTARLEAAGVQVLRVPADPHGRVSILHLLRELASRGIVHLLVEGGASVHGSFFAAGLVDRVVAFIAPKLVGGRAAPGPIGDPGVDALAAAPALHRPTWRRIGEDWMISGYLRDPAALVCDQPPACREGPPPAPRAPGGTPGPATPGESAGTR